MSSTTRISPSISHNALMLYVRMALTIIIGLYTSRVILEQLGITNFGIFGAVSSIVALTEFINSALNSSFSRFYAYYLGQNNNSSREKIFTAANIISIIAAVIIILLGKTIGLWYFSNHLEIPLERIDVAKFTYNCCVTCAAIRVLQIPYSSCLIAHERMGAFAYIEILNSILRLAAAIHLAHYSLDKLEFYSMLILAITIIIFICYFTYCRITFREYIAYTPRSISKGTLIQMSKFSILDLYGTICYSTRTHGTALILNSFFGVALNAANAIALSLQNILNGISGNIIIAFNPQIIKKYSENAIDQMLELIFKSTRYSFFLYLIIAIPLIIETEQILHFWLGNNLPQYSTSFCQLIIITTGLAIPVNVLNTCIHATGKIKILSIVIGSIYLLTLPIIYTCFNYQLSPNYAYISYIAIMLIVIIATLLNVKHLIKQFHILNYFNKVVFPIFAVIAFSISITLLSHLIIGDHFLHSIIIIPISIIATISSIIIIGLNNNERNSLISKIKKGR